MSIYIADEKNNIITHYCTTRKIEKAIQTLLEQERFIVGSVSEEGYAIQYVKVKEDTNGNSN